MKRSILTIAVSSILGSLAVAAHAQQTNTTESTRDTREITRDTTRDTDETRNTERTTDRTSERAGRQDTTAADRSSNSNMERSKYDSTTKSADSMLKDADKTKVKQAARTSEGFVKAAAQAGMLEVETGKLAKDKAQDQDVKEYADMMVKHHSKANDELKQVAKDNNIALPTSLDAEHRAQLDQLKQKSGVEFDKAYSEMMARDHEKAVMLFREAGSATGVDNEVQAYARKTLPTLQKHLEEGRELYSETHAGAPRQSSAITRSRSDAASTSQPSQAARTGERTTSTRDNTERRSN